MSDSRRYPSRPLLGVGALIFQNGLLLMIERGSEPYKGYWSLPGGAVETGELLEDAIRREVREETGLEVSVEHQFEVFERIARDAEGRAEYHYVLVDYICSVQSGDLRAGDDAAGAAWVEESALDGMQITAGSLPVIRRAFAWAKERGL